MRWMKKVNHDGSVTRIQIEQHIVLKNFWEYYITTRRFEADKDIACALVLGYELELGDVRLSELKPYILSSTTDLKDVMPAPNWTWE